MQPKADRQAAFANTLRTFEVSHLQQAASYLRQQIERRERVVAMVGLGSIITGLRLIEENEQPPLSSIIQALWLAADYLPLQQSWPHNQTTRPILLVVVEEAHMRQGLATSSAHTSLTNPTSIRPMKEPCDTQQTLQRPLIRWVRSLLKAD